jgi:hypothetical protein
VSFHFPWLARDVDTSLNSVDYETGGSLSGGVTPKARTRKLSSHQDRIGHQFAIATARLEDALSIAVAGQNGRLTRTAQRRLQKRLARAIDRCITSVERIAESLTD